MTGRPAFAWPLALGLTLSACTPGIQVRMAADSPAIQRVAADNPPLQWKIPLGVSVVEDLQLLGEDVLYLALRNDDAKLTNADLLLVDRRRGKVRWRYDRSSLPGDYTLLGDVGGRLLLRVDGPEDGTLLALDLSTGAPLWQQGVKGGLGQHHLLEQAEAVVIAGMTSDRLRLAAFALADGRDLWTREYPATSQAPATLADAESVWVLGDGVERLAGSSGAPLWRRPGIALAAEGPTPHWFADTLHLLDADHTLRILAADSGEALARVPIDRQYRITNIYPTVNRVYLRGRRQTDADDAGPQQTAEARIEAAVRQSLRESLGTLDSDAAAVGSHVLLALSPESGTTDWVHTSGEPSVSNIIERDQQVFHATASRLVCLDSATGELRYSRFVTNAGQNYPVRIRLAGEHMVYLGEWILAAFDPDTGEPAYRHGMNPVPDGSATLSGLRQAIDRLQSRLGLDTPDSLGISTSLGLTATRLQNSANTYHAKANYYFSQSQVNPLPGRRSDLFYRSTQARMTAQIESSFAQAYRSMAMTMAVWELNAALEQAARKAALESEIAHARLYRKAILNGFPEAEGPQLFYRPHNNLKDFVGVTLVNLENGARRDLMLSPRYQDYGIWNQVDTEQGMIYHHGVGLDTAAHQALPQRRGLNSFHILESYLLAYPFDPS